MTDMIGMDVEAVRRIAAELRRKAGDVRAIDTRVNAIVGQIDGNWQGNRARQFVYDWQNHHRSALRLLADRIEGLGQSALNNAAEQESASRSGAGAASHGSAGSVGGSGGGAARGYAAEIAIAMGLTSSVANAKNLVKLSAMLSANKYSVGRYSGAWNKALKFADGVTIGGHRVVPDDLLRFKRSPVTQFLNQHQGILKVGSTGVGVVDFVDAGSSSYFAFSTGDVRNGTADGLNAVTRVGDQIVGKSLVGRLAMTDVRLWTEVGRAATNPEIDYSAKGIQQVFTASPGEWFTAIKETSPQFAKTIFGKVL